MIGGQRPPVPKILDQTDRVGAKSPFSIYFRFQLTLIGSPLRAIQRAQDEHRTLFLSPPPKGGSKTQSAQHLNNKLR